MNERYKTLWSEAAESNGGDSWEEQTAFMSKFAELIVKECEQVSLKNSHRDDDMGAIIAKQIKEHFGVEERKGWVCPKCGVDRTREACPRGHTAAITGDCPMTATAQSGVEE